LADQERSIFSRGELTPYNERGSVVLFENIAAVEGAVVIEVVVDRGKDGGEFLEAIYIPKPRHCSFSLSEWLM